MTQKKRDSLLRDAATALAGGNILVDRRWANECDRIAKRLARAVQVLLAEPDKVIDCTTKGAGY